MGDYEAKYLKYKTKYLTLKEELEGGGRNETLLFRLEILIDKQLETEISTAYEPNKLEKIKQYIIINEIVQTIIELCLRNSFKGLFSKGLFSKQFDIYFKINSNERVNKLVTKTPLNDDEKRELNEKLNINKKIYLIISWIIAILEKYEPKNYILDKNIKKFKELLKDIEKINKMIDHTYNVSIDNINMWLNILPLTEINKYDINELPIQTTGTPSKGTPSKGTPSTGTPPIFGSKKHPDSLNLTSISS